MAGKSPAAPAAPDPVATANAQGQMNRETAIAQQGLNSTNQLTPYGNLTYQQIGSWADGTPQFQATQTLAPSEQRQLDLSNQASETYGRAANAQLGQVEDRLSQPFNPNLPNFTGGANNRAGYVQTGVNDPSGSLTYAGPSRSNQMQTDIYNPSGSLTYAGPGHSNQITGQVDVSGLGDGNGSRDAVQSALMSRMDPGLQQLRTTKETSLRNQGIMPGTEAWQNEMRDVSQSENDARMSAIINAGQEQSRVYDVARQNAGFGNTAAGQQQGLDLSAANFNNQALSQSQQMQLASAGFRNQAVGQQQGLDLSSADFNNQALAQGQNMQMASAGFNNQAVGQQQNMDLAAAGFGNQARQQSLQEQLALRNQPINEASSLLTGQMVQTPQFTNTPQSQIAPTDYLGAVGLQQQSLNNSYNQRNANYQANLAGLYGLGSAAIGGAGMAAGGGMGGGTSGGFAYNRMPR